MTTEQIEGLINRCKTKDSNLNKELDDLLSYISEKLVDVSHYIAIKYWNKEDIIISIEKRGYLASEENIEKVMNSDDLEMLTYINEYDEEIINQCIDTVLG